MRKTVFFVIDATLGMLVLTSAALLWVMWFKLLCLLLR